MAVKTGSSWPRSSSSEAAASRSAPSKSPAIGKVHAIASWATACRKGSSIPASSGARRWRAASAAASSPMSTASTAAAQASSARACGSSVPSRAAAAPPRTRPRARGPAATRTATGPGTGAAAARGHGPGTSAPRRPGCPPRPAAAPATRSGRGRAAAGPPARPAPGSSRRAGARPRRRRAGPPAARPRTRGRSPASATGARARCCRGRPGCAGPAPRQLQRPVLLQARHLGGGLDGPAVDEHRRDLQQRPLGVVQQAHAPLHRGPQGALPLGQVHRAGPERIQRGRQPVQQRGRVQQPGAGGGQLDRQRQALQPPADLRHRRRVALGEGKAGPHRAGPVHEQRHRRRGRHLRDRGGARIGRQRQRRHRVLPLGAQPQHRAAGGQDRHPRAAGQQLAQVGGDLDHLLQVVQDQQPRAVAERLGQRLQRRRPPGQVGARRPADGGQDQPRVGDRVQRHEHGARAEPVPQPLAHRHRQPGLADPARPGQRHQPHPGRSTSPATSSMACSRPSSDVVLTGSGRGPRAPAGDGAAAAAWPPAAANRSLSSTARSSRTSRPSSAGVRKCR